MEYIYDPFRDDNEKKNELQRFKNKNEVKQRIIFWTEGVIYRRFMSHDI